MKRVSNRFPCFFVCLLVPLVYVCICPFILGGGAAAGAEQRCADRVGGDGARVDGVAQVAQRATRRGHSLLLFYPYAHHMVHPTFETGEERRPMLIHMLLFVVGFLLRSYYYY